VPNQEHEREREREIKQIATGTYPQPRGWTTPSSSWRPPGWWRWPPVMISPSDRVPEQGSRWYFFGIEACGGVVEVLGLFLGVSLYIGFFSIGITQKGATRAPQGNSTQPPHGTPCCLVSSSWGFLSFHEASGVSYVPKKSSIFLGSIQELLFLHKKQHHGSSAENSVSPG
jgi:hypothetical protein